jgi:hypothetical protein
MSRQALRSESGQTLVALLIFMMLAITITTTSVVITIINTQSRVVGISGDAALDAAQSGAENALLHLERDPTYTGEAMTLGNGTATITVSGTSTKTIVSVGSVGNSQRTITVLANDTGTAISESSWSETP